LSRALRLRETAVSLNLGRVRHEDSMAYEVGHVEL